LAAEEWVVVRLRMQDSRRFITDAKLAGASVRELGNASRYTGTQFHYLGGRGFWLNQIFFTLRRTIYSVTLGMIVLAGLAIKTGFAFNAMMEQQALAFRVMTGSAAAATKEVKFLFNLAARGPFEFQQVIQGARQLMAFGMTVSRTNELLVSLQDAMAGMGLDQEALDRATLALGQIQSSGRLLGQDLRQLEQLGLVNPQDLARRLHIDPSQIANVGQLNIPSKVAIDAIMAYWREKFHGAAKEFQHTWIGGLSTIKDYGRALFGEMVKPLQDRIARDVFPMLMRIMRQSQKVFPSQGFAGVLGVVDRNVGHGLQLERSWNNLVRLGRALRDVLLPLAQAFLFAFHVIQPWRIIITPLTLILIALGKALHLLQPILGPLVALWIAEHTAIALVTIATKSYVFWTVLLTAWEKRKAFWIGLATIATRRSTAANWLDVAALRARLFATKEVWLADRKSFATVFANEGKLARFGRYIWGLVPALIAAAAATWSFTIALLANPITWVVLAIVALTAGLVVLYFKWQAFHDLINRTARWFWTHWPITVILLATTLGPLGALIAATVTIIRHFRTLVHWARAAAHAIASIPGAGMVGRALHLAGAVLPHFALGGTMAHSGVAVVGERGPELAFLPGGTRIAPNHALPALASAAPATGARLPRMLRIVNPISIDGKQIAEVVADYHLDALARA
jgi:hypothetical protein